MVSMSTICDLGTCWNVLDINKTFIVELTDEVVPDANALRALTDGGIGDNFDSPLVVLPNLLGSHQSGNESKNFNVHMIVNGFLNIQKFKCRKIMNLMIEERYSRIF